MNIHGKRKNLSRMLSLLLSVVMVLSLLPVSALGAEKTPEIGGGTGSGGENFEGTGSDDNWLPVGYGKTFIRLTIVGFPGGVDSWDEGEMITYGSLDTSSTYNTKDMGKVTRWWDTNAVSGRRAGKASGDYSAYYKGREKEGGYSSRFTEFSSIPGMPSGVELPKMFGSGTSGENTMLELFTNKEGEANEVFEAVIAAVTNTGKIPLDAEQFKHGAAEYRLIIEPGVLTLINGEVAAMTWRDMAAYSLNNSTVTGNKRPSYTWNTNSQNIAYGLYLTRNEFATGTGEDTTSPNDGTAIFKAVPETPAFGDGSDKLKFPYFRDHCWDTGYALGVINPGDVGGDTFNSYVGRINIYLPTGADLGSQVGEAVNKNIGAEYFTYLGSRGDLYEAIDNVPNAAGLNSMRSNSPDSYEVYRIVQGMRLHRYGGG